MAVIHPLVKKTLGYDSDIGSVEILHDWKKRTSRICKPCWELQYCPYGPVVEDFPLLPIIQSEAKDHCDYLRTCLKSGRLGNGYKMRAQQRKMFQRKIAHIKSQKFPESIPKILTEASCKVFGHICPVFFVAEPLTETKDRRNLTRSIPRDVMLKVVRRDGQICQRCHKPVPDNEVEFDHIIPYSKGGRSIADNLRLVHRNCNRTKSNSLQEILHPKPIQHLIDLRKERK